jgi:hypothetical protein
MNNPYDQIAPKSIAPEQQAVRQKLGKTTVVPNTANVDMTVTTLPANPLTYPNQALKNVPKGKTIDKVQTATWSD